MLKQGYSTFFNIVIYLVILPINNEIKRAYNSLRIQKALSMFNKEYKTLTNSQKREIELIYPIKISEAEPENVLGLN